MIKYDSIENILQSLKEKFFRQEKEIERLRLENAKLKNGIWQEEEMAWLKAEYDRMKEEYHRGFSISKEEKAMINEFINQHKGYYGAIGGGFSYQFIPTSIGIIGTIIASNGDKLVFRELG